MIEIRPGFDDTDRTRAAALYWEAFGGKLGKVMGPKPRALAFIERVIDPSHAFSAYEGSTLLGLAGFKTMDGALVGGDFNDLQAIYGRWGALWRAGALWLLERDTENARFLMDGIVTTEAARGRGVGTKLLEAISDEARSRGYSAVRLDVIDTNPRARALYERRGFRPVGTEKSSITKVLFGFESATTMVRDL